MYVYFVSHSIYIIGSGESNISVLFQPLKSELLICDRKKNIKESEKSSKNVVYINDNIRMAKYGHSRFYQAFIYDIKF